MSYLVAVQPFHSLLWTLVPWNWQHKWFSFYGTKRKQKRLISVQIYWWAKQISVKTGRRLLMIFYVTFKEVQKLSQKGIFDGFHIITFNILHIKRWGIFPCTWGCWNIVDLEMFDSLISFTLKIYFVWRTLFSCTLRLENKFKAENNDQTLDSIAENFEKTLAERARIKVHRKEGSP